MPKILKNHVNIFGIPHQDFELDFDLDFSFSRFFFQISKIIVIYEQFTKHTDELTFGEVNPSVPCYRILEGERNNV